MIENANPAALASQALEARIRANAMLALELNDPLLWAASVWTIRGDQSKRYDMSAFPFLKEPVQDKSALKVIMASGGIGKTEAFIPLALFKADSGRRVIYSFETESKTGLIVQERLNPNIENSPYLRLRCKDTDNVKLKIVGKGVLFCIGLGGDSATASYHGDDLFLDERDLMDPHRVDLMHKRLNSSPDPQEVDISNPKAGKGAGIHKDFLAGDQRLWFVPCDQCGKSNALNFRTHLDRAKARVLCPSCGKPMNRLGLGHWRPTNPKGTHASWHINGLMNPVLRLEQVCADLDSPMSSRRRAATIMDLGEPFEDKDAGLSDSDLWNADGGDVWSQHAPGGFLVCDPGGVFDVQIWQWKRKGEPPVCTWAGAVEGWGQLEKLVDASRVVGGLIDNQPETSQGKRFCMEMKKKGLDFRRCAYTVSGEAPPEFVEDREDPYLINANRTLCIEAMVDSVRGGLIRFPKRLVRDGETRWAQHMKAPRRAVDPDRAGVNRVKWVHREADPDHQFHCSVYAWIWQSLKIPTQSSQGMGGSYSY